MAPRRFPVVPWGQLLPNLMYHWDQGEHVLMLGRTGKGKTTLAISLLDERHKLRSTSCIILATKIRDEGLSNLTHRGWHIIRSWPPNYEQRQSGKIIFWPQYSLPSKSREEVGPALVEALDNLLLEGNWCVYIDEMAYLVQTLGMRNLIDEYWNGARSNGISLIAGNQRPVHVARSMLANQTWAAVFRLPDLADRQRAGEILGNKKLYTEIIGSLSGHQFFLLNSDSERGVISQVEM